MPPFYLAELFRTLSAAAVVVFLFELAPGLRHAAKGKPRGHDRLTRWWALYLALVVFALAIAYYALMVDVNEDYSSNNGLGSVDLFSFNRTGAKRVKTIRDLVSATQIILWVAALMIMGLTV